MIENKKYILMLASPHYYFTAFKIFFKLVKINFSRRFVISKLIINLLREVIAGEILFIFCFWCLAWGSNSGFMSNKPTHYLLHYGDIKLDTRCFEFQMLETMLHHSIALQAHIFLIICKMHIKSYDFKLGLLLVKKIIVP